MAEWNIAINSFIALAAFISAIAATVSASSSTKSSNIAKKMAEDQRRKDMKKAFSDPEEKGSGLALVRLKNGDTYEGRVTIDRDGHITCSDMKEHLDRAVGGVPPDKSSLFFVPEEYLDEGISQRLGYTWLNRSEVSVIIFKDSDINN